MKLLPMHRFRGNVSILKKWKEWLSVDFKVHYGKFILYFSVKNFSERSFSDVHLKKSVFHCRSQSYISSKSGNNWILWLAFAMMSAAASFVSNKNRRRFYSLGIERRSSILDFVMKIPKNSLYLNI